MRASIPSLCAVIFAAACSTNQPERLDAAHPDVHVADDGAVAMDATVADAIDAATDGSDVADVSSDSAVDAGCFVGTPHARLEFLNRCTDAETTDKVVTLPLARSDGTLPPLP